MIRAKLFPKEFQQLIKSGTRDGTVHEFVCFSAQEGHMIKDQKKVYIDVHDTKGHHAIFSFDIDDIIKTKTVTSNRVAFVDLTPMYYSFREDQYSITFQYPNDRYEELSNAIALFHQELDFEQKVEAMSLKHYDGYQWKPKAGDFYTTDRNDLELYQIVDEDEDHFCTNYCDHENRTDEPAIWLKDSFLRDFGIHRCHITHELLIRKHIR